MHLLDVVDFLKKKVWTDYQINTLFSK